MKDPITVVGDLHGQYYDLEKILDLGGMPSIRHDLAQNKFLFLGDYVDRGAFSVEVVILLYALKLNFPNEVFLIRRYHECRKRS